jgi:hypothetical protein
MKEEESSQENLRYHRLRAFENCSLGKEQLTEKAVTPPFPEMTAEKCSCFEAYFFEGTSALNISRQEWAAWKKDKCSILKFHYRCDRQGTGEGDPDGFLACPLGCFAPPRRD